LFVALRLFRSAEEAAPGRYCLLAGLLNQSDVVVFDECFETWRHDVEFSVCEVEVLYDGGLFDGAHFVEVKAFEEFVVVVCTFSGRAFSCELVDFLGVVDVVVEFVVFRAVAGLCEVAVEVVSSCRVVSFFRHLVRILYWFVSRSWCCERLVLFVVL